MLAYRWEHKADGEGPIARTVLDSDGDQICWVELFYDHSSPCMFSEWFDYLEHTEYLRTEHYHGWSTMNKLQRFMRPGAETKLIELGYELTTYEVTEEFCVLPDGQVVFVKSLAQRVA